MQKNLECSIWIRILCRGNCFIIKSIWFVHSYAYIIFTTLNKKVLKWSLENNHIIIEIILGLSLSDKEVSSQSPLASQWNNKINVNMLVFSYMQCTFGYYSLKGYRMYNNQDYIMICDTHAYVTHRRMCHRAYCTIQRQPGAFLKDLYGFQFSKGIGIVTSLLY